MGEPSRASATICGGCPDSFVRGSPPQASRIEFSIHPNPFTEKATILLALPVAEHVGIRIFDLAGREIRTLVDGRLPAGRNSIDWDGRDGGVHMGFIGLV